MMEVINHQYKAQETEPLISSLEEKNDTAKLIRENPVGYEAKYDQTEKQRDKKEQRHNSAFMAWFVSATCIGGVFYGYDSSMIGVAQLYF